MGRLRGAGDINIKKLTRKSVEPYAMIIDGSCVPDSGKGNNFGILMKEKSRGWRIGYLVVRDRAIKRMERHPDSFETFEPVKGRLVIAFAGNKDPAKTEFFFLDKGVVVKKGIWHEVAAIGGSAEVKIFENIEVKTEYLEIKNGYLF